MTALSRLSCVWSTTSCISYTELQQALRGLRYVGFAACAFLRKAVPALSSVLETVKPNYCVNTRTRKPEHQRVIWWFPKLER